MSRVDYFQDLCHLVSTKAAYAAEDELSPRSAYTPESLYAECVGFKQEPLRHLEQLTAVRTKTMLQLQASYEALVNRPVLLERLRMQNELMRRDLKAIEVNAKSVKDSKGETD